MNRQTRRSSITGANSLSLNDQHDNDRSASKRMDKFRVRVLQKNLVYCIGLPPEIAKSEVLEKHQYLGQYGEIDKISINKNGFTGKTQKGPSFSVYISFKHEIQASVAILGLNNLVCEQQLVRASFGTTKYCTYFLKKIECPNLPGCYFLHCFDKENEIEEKDSKPNKELFDSQQKIAEKIVRQNYKELNILESDDESTVFPTVKQILDEYIFNKENEENPQHLDAEKPHSQPEPQRQKLPQGQELQQLQEPRLLKTHSEIVTRHKIQQSSLQQYIHRLILSNCLKSCGIKSKFQFAKNQQGHDEHQIRRLRKYMVQHLKKDIIKS